MAKQRVMVGELNAPTEVTPTARPVDTYISPEKPIVQPSPLSQFLAAISPLTNLVQEEAQKEKAQQDRDEFNGRRANEQHQAEMAAINLTATLKEDWTTNQNDWLSMSTEQAAEKVSKHYTNYRMQLDKAQINPLALQAFDQKVDEDKLLFMFNNFGPEKRKRNIEQQDQQFNDTIRKAGSVAATAEEIVPAMVDAFNQHVAVTGNDYRRANDVVIATALQESKKGRTNYIEFLDAIKTKDGKSLRSIDRYAKDFNTIDANIAAFAKSGLTLQNKEDVEAFKVQAAANWMQNPNPTTLTFGKNTRVNAQGHEFDWTPAEQASYIEDNYNVQVAQLNASDASAKDKVIQRTVLDQSRVGFYKAYQLLPKEVEKSQQIFQQDFKFANFKDPEVFKFYRAAYDAMDAWEQQGGDATKGMPKDLKNTFDAVQILVKNEVPLQDALTRMQQPVFPNRPSIPLDIKDLPSLLDPSVLKFTDLDEVKNMGILYNEVMELLPVIAQTSLAKDEDVIKDVIGRISKRYQVVAGSAIKLPVDTIAGQPAPEMIEKNVDKIWNNDIAIQVIMNNLGLPMPAKVERTGVAATSQLATAPRISKNEAPFTLTVESTGNDDMINVVALGKDGTDAAGQRTVVSTVVLSKFNENAMNGFTEQTVEQINSRIANNELSTYELYGPAQEIAYQASLVAAGKAPAQTGASEVTRVQPFNYFQAKMADAAGTQALKERAIEKFAKEGLTWTTEAARMWESLTDSVSEYFQGVEERGKKQAPSENPLTKLMRDKPAKEAFADVAGQVADVVTAVPKGLMAVNEALITPAGASTLETSFEKPVLPNAEFEGVVDHAVKLKGGTVDNLIEDLILPISWVETKFKNITQVGGKKDKEGQGYFQFEGKYGDNLEFNSAITRANNFYTKSNQPKPKWLTSIKKGDTAKKLTPRDQASLLVINFLEKEEVDISTVLGQSTPEARREAAKQIWLNYHWAGDESKIPEQTNKWNRDMKSFDAVKQRGKSLFTLPPIPKSKPKANKGNSTIPNTLQSFGFEDDTP
jgi:hypothetical protein